MHYIKQEYHVKKTLTHPKLDARQREQFKHLIEDLEPEFLLIYIDESVFQRDDTRSHSYSYKRTRAEGTFNWQVKNSCNAIGALIKNKLLMVSLFNCSIMTEVFEG